MQPHCAAVLQLHQGGKFLRAILYCAQPLTANAGQVKNRRCSGRRSTLYHPRLDAAQPQRRTRAFFRRVTTEQIELRQHRLQFRQDGFPQAFWVSPEHRAGRYLIAGGIGLGGCSKGGNKPLGNCFTHCYNHPWESFRRLTVPFSKNTSRWGNVMCLNMQDRSGLSI